MKINSSPYTFERIFPTNQNKKPRKAFKIIQNLKVQLIKINNIQEPGNSKKQDQRKSKKNFSLQTRTKSTETCNSFQINQNPKKKKKNPLV